MLRELSQLLMELHDGLAAAQSRGLPAQVHLAHVEMTLPLELRPVFRDGGCVLLAELPRSREANAFQVTPSRLRIGWGTGGEP